MPAAASAPASTSSAVPPPATAAAAADTRLSRMKLKDQILTDLKRDGVKKLILHGEAGVGKTWMARELSIQAVVEDFVDVVLWVYLNRTYDEHSLYKSIACQLSQPLDPAGGWESYNDMGMEDLKQYVSKLLKEKKCLLVLDDEGKMMAESETMAMLKDVLNPDEQKQSKVLITRRDCNHDDGNAIVCKKLEPLTEDDSISLLKDRAGPKAVTLLDPDQLSKAITETCKNLPAEIVFRAAALRHIEDEYDAFIVDCALQEVVQAKEYWKLWSGYEKFLGSSMIDCFWLSRQYLERYKSINYNELICYWILEGCVGKFNSLEKAYDKGHAILMDLIGGGMLGQREAGDIVMETAGDKFADFHPEPWGKSELGLFNISKDQSWNGLGELIHQEGRIEARGTNGKDLLTLLIDGKDLSRMDQKDVTELQVLYIYSPIFKSLLHLFPHMKELRVLVLRDCKFLNQDDVRGIAQLKKLTALEISGPGSKNLELFPGEFFKNLVGLQVLNLSGLQIGSLPLIDALTKLRWLILRRCTQLKVLPSVKHLKELEVLDLSGATALGKFGDEKFEQNLKLRVLGISETTVSKLPILADLAELTHLLLRGCSNLNKLRTLKSCANVQVIDFSGCRTIASIKPNELPSGDCVISLNLSGTAIKEVPPIKMSNLQCLCLKGCDKLVGLPHEIISENLRILDLSGCSALKEVGDDFFKDLKCLLELNLSNTGLKQLPTSLCNLCNLRKLILSGCHSVSSKSLAEMKGLTSLLMLDLSDCTKLRAIPDELFSHMPHLLKLDLSKTGIVELGNAFSVCNHLSHLLLTHCSKLAKLPPRNSLTKLKVLNISGATSLEEVPANFFQHMTQLRQLFLSGCSELKEVPSLENLKGLEVLDLSRTGVRGNLSLVPLTNLRKLLLRDCSSVKELAPPQSLCCLEMLDLHGTDIREFPYRIMELSTGVKHLDLPDKLDLGSVDRRKITVTTLPEEIYYCGNKKDFSDHLKF